VTHQPAISPAIGHLWTLDQAIGARQTWLENDPPLVFTNGHFDLLHAGHVDYLEQARAQGGSAAVLIVGINGDASTRRLKGIGRPLIPAMERARLVAALRCVTATVIFEDDTAITIIQSLRPNWYVKGGDYSAKPWPERDLAVALGISVALIPFMADHSTSGLIARIQTMPR